MKLTQVMRLAREGRPDLAAKNLGASGCGTWRYPVRLIPLLVKYPYEDGSFPTVRYLALCWKEGRESL